MSLIKRYRNKICALVFSSLAILAFILGYVFYGIVAGWGFLASSPLTTISILFTLVIYIMVLVTNIQNDNRAYSAIMMFVFLAAWRIIWALIPSGFNVFSYIGVSPGQTALSILMLLNYLACAALGVIFYIFLLRYRLGRGSFKILSAIGWCFVVALSIAAFLEIGLALYGGSFPPLTVAYVVLAYAADALMGVAIMFTLYRLRTY